MTEAPDGLSRPRLQMILGSTRPTRNGDTVVSWLSERISGDRRFELELLDLRDWALPIFQEHSGTIGDHADPTYSEPIVKRWNKKIASGDAYLFVTPEYTHGIPAVLKNAIDSVFLSWAFRNKPAGFVGYSGGLVAGARAIEQLSMNAIESEMVPLRNSVLIARVTSAFEDGVPRDGETDRCLDILLEDLAWWTAALTRARADGELPPAALRPR